MNQAITTDEDQAAYWARHIEDRASRRTAKTITEVRPEIARAMGVLPGTLENLRRGRIKEIKKRVYNRIKAAFMREVEAELRKWEHEQHILAQTGADPSGVEAQEVAAHLAALRRLLGKEG